MAKTVQSKAAQPLQFKKTTPLLASGVQQPGLFTELSVVEVKRELTRSLKGTGISIAFGGVDVSVEEHKNKPSKKRLVTHSHVMIPTDKAQAFEENIRPLLVGKKTARVPLMAKTWKGDRSGVAYMYQHSLDRRTNPAPDESKGSKKAKNNPARVEDVVQIALALDKLGLERKTILLGLRPYVKNGKAELVLLPNENQGLGSKKRIEASKSPVDSEKLGPLGKMSKQLLEAKAPRHHAHASSGERATAPARHPEKQTKRAARRHGGTPSNVDSNASMPPALSDQKPPARKAAKLPNKSKKMKVDPFVLNAADIEDQDTGNGFRRFDFSKLHGEIGSAIIPGHDARDWRKVLAELENKNFVGPVEDVDREAMLKTAVRTEPSEYLLAAQHVGWLPGNKTFVHGADVIGDKLTRGRSIVSPRFLTVQDIKDTAPEGTVEAWISTVGRISAYSTRLQLVVAAAFAAPLLKYVGFSSFLITLYGPAKVGKSAALLAASSVSGPGDEPKLVALNATDAALYQHAPLYNDRMIPLNEVALAASKKTNAYEAIRQRIYGLAEGRDKRRHRASKYDPPASSAESRIIAIMTSEHSIERLAVLSGVTRDDGEKARGPDVAALAGSHTVIFDRIPSSVSKQERATWSSKKLEALREACSKNHGVALRPFIEHLLELQDKCLSNIDAYMQDIEPLLFELTYADPARKHSAKNFSLIYAAGSLAIEAGLLVWNRKQFRSAVVSCFKSAMVAWGISQPATLGPQQNLRAFIQRHELPDAGKVSNINPKRFVGYFRLVGRERVYRILSSELRNAFRSRRELSAALAWLYENGRLGDGKAHFELSAGKTEWAVKSPRWPDKVSKPKSIEFRWLHT